MQEVSCWLLWCQLWCHHWPQFSTAAVPSSPLIFGAASGKMPMTWNSWLWAGKNAFLVFIMMSLSWMIIFFNHDPQVFAVYLSGKVCIPFVLVCQNLELMGRRNFCVIIFMWSNLAPLFLLLEIILNRMQLLNFATCTHLHFPVFQSVCARNGGNRSGMDSNCTKLCWTLPLHPERDQLPCSTYLCSLCAGCIMGGLHRTGISHFMLRKSLSNNSL